MKIRFVETVKVQAVDGETFVGGQVYDLPEPSALRWISRKKAELFVETEQAEQPAKKPAKAKG